MKVIITMEKRQFRIYEKIAYNDLGQSIFYPQELMGDQWYYMGVVDRFDTLQEARKYLDAIVSPPQPIYHPYP